MVPEMLDIEVPESMMSQKPANYTSYANHLQDVKETKEKFEKAKADKAAIRKAKRGPERSRQLKMDVSVTVGDSVSTGNEETEQMEHQIESRGTVT